MMLLNGILMNVLYIGAGFVFIKSSIGKLKNPYAFGRVIESYHLFFKGTFTLFLAALIGPVELVVGMMIIAEPFRVVGLLIGILLQLMFLLLMSLKLNQTLPFGCGCFGLHAPEKISAKKVMFNLGYTVLLVALISLNVNEVIREMLQ
ncbi:MauE/DoxX family redox-associated membrane protein [Bacillus spizizenii]|uniref:MauE/DoxX family redox-associated membrane protein n=1 Tax=Bacillus spizizenii TaxID=96241 RepID=UPI001C61273F|nr:MauE/DoxX family redox-associated membrane protein [Bacillus spizizenii]